MKKGSRMIDLGDEKIFDLGIGYFYLGSGKGGIFLTPKYAEELIDTFIYFSDPGIQKNLPYNGINLNGVCELRYDNGSLSFVDASGKIYSEIEKYLKGGFNFYRYLDQIDPKIMCMGSESTNNLYDHEERGPRKKLFRKIKKMLILGVASLFPLALVMHTLNNLNVFEKNASNGQTITKNNMGLEDKISFANQTYNPKSIQTLGQISNQRLYEDVSEDKISFANQTYNPKSIQTLGQISNQKPHEDKTLMEIKNFLKKDQTDKHQYVPGEFICGDYARMLKKNAPFGLYYVYLVGKPGVRDHIITAYWMGGKWYFIEPYDDSVYTEKEFIEGYSHFYRAAIVGTDLSSTKGQLSHLEGHIVRIINF